MAQLSEAEIARRLPVWCALSDLFLDTAFDASHDRRIAEVIRAGGFSAREAEDILMHEVAPAFGANLRSVAGEWAGWSEDFVREQVLARRRSIPSRIVNRLTIDHHLKSEWARIAAHLGD